VARVRVQTARIDGNQERIDELEYFIEGIGRILLGPEGENFRVLGEYLPRTRNLSALVNLSRAAGTDIAEDLRFLFSELRNRTGPQVPVENPDFRGDLAVLRYDRYVKLLEKPEFLLDRVPTPMRLEVATLLGRGLSYLAPATARINAFAWLHAVGIPDLRGELLETEPPSLVLGREAPRGDLGLSKTLAALRLRMGPGLRSFLEAAFRELRDDYRRQLARFEAPTQPLA
jgi:hypothetical protein